MNNLVFWVTLIRVISDLHISSIQWYTRDSAIFCYTKGGRMGSTKKSLFLRIFNSYKEPQPWGQGMFLDYGLVLLSGSISPFHSALSNKNRLDKSTFLSEMASSPTASVLLVKPQPLSIRYLPFLLSTCLFLESFLPFKILGQNVPFKCN